MPTWKLSVLTHPGAEVQRTLWIRGQLDGLVSS
jgi:hypothetical protein